MNTCRLCLSGNNLNCIFVNTAQCERYSVVLALTTGLKVSNLKLWLYSDGLSFFLLTDYWIAFYRLQKWRRYFLCMAFTPTLNVNRFCIPFRCSFFCWKCLSTLVSPRFNHTHYSTTNSKSIVWITVRKTVWTFRCSGWCSHLYHCYEKCIMY